MASPLKPKKGGLLDTILSEAEERLGLTAYHGTPHKVDKFSMSKIGTGEDVVDQKVKQIANTYMKTGK